MSTETDALNFLWVDTETFGLDFENDPIIEVGLCLTAPDLTVIDQAAWRIWSHRHERRLEAMEPGDFVFEMHTASGLFEAARTLGQYSTPRQAEESITYWLQEKGVTKAHPMCGSSVQFDRQMLAAQMPQVESVFSYRNIDISTLKELCRRVNPEMYAGLEEDVVPAKRHRALPDLKDTIAEARWYFDNFLWLAADNA